MPVVAYGHNSMLMAASLCSCITVVNFADEIDKLMAPDFDAMVPPQRQALRP